MLLVSSSESMQELFGILGHPSNRHELEGSNSATDARPSIRSRFRLPSRFQVQVAFAKNWLGKALNYHHQRE